MWQRIKNRPVLFGGAVVTAIIVVVTVLLILSLSTMGFAGGGGSTADSAPSDPGIASEPLPELAPTQPALIEATPLGGAGGGDNAPIPASNTIQQQQERLIIKNGELTLLVSDIDASIRDITSVASQRGGYVISSEATSGSFGDAATVQIAVESAQFEGAMEDLKDTADEVLRESASGTDVTEEFVDLGSRMRNLEQTRDRLREFLDEAETVEEALLVNSQLTQIEGQIEQVQGRMNFLSQRAALSTITIRLETMPPPTPTPTPSGWTPSQTVQRATRTQVALFQGLIDLAIWLVLVPGPYLLVIGVILFGVRYFNRNKHNQPNLVTNDDDYKSE